MNLRWHREHEDAINTASHSQTRRTSIYYDCSFYPVPHIGTEVHIKKIMQYLWITDCSFNSIIFLINREITDGQWARFKTQWIRGTLFYPCPLKCQVFDCGSFEPVTCAYPDITCCALTTTSKLHGQLHHPNIINENHAELTNTNLKLLKQNKWHAITCVSG